MSDKNIVLGFSVDSKKLQSGLKEVGSILLNSTSNITKGLTPALDKLTGSTEKATEKFKSLRTQIRESTNAAAQLAEKYGMTHAATKEAIKQTGLLKDKQEKLSEAIAASHPDAKFVVLKNAVQGAANAFAGIQGAMAMFGEQNKDVQAALLKVQAAMAFAQGIAAIEQLEIAFKGLYTIIAANPMIAAAAGIAAAAAAIAYALGLFDSFRVKATNYEKSQNIIVAANKKAEESAASEVASVKTLIDIAKNEANSKQLRVDAIKKLNEISPEYAKNINTENINTEKGIDLTNQLTTAVWNNAKAKAYAKEIEEQYSVIIKEQAKLDRDAANAKKFNVQPKIDPETGQPIKIIGNFEDKAKAESENAIKVAKSAIDYFQSEITKYSKDGKLNIFGTKDEKKKPEKEVEDESAKIRFLKPIDELKKLKAEMPKFHPLRVSITLDPYFDKSTYTKLNFIFDQIKSVINPLIENMGNMVAASLGESLGQGVANAIDNQSDPFKSFADMIVNSIVEMGKQIGAAFIAAGMGLLVASMGASPQGWAMVAGGTMLVGLSSGITQARKNNAATRQERMNGGSVDSGGSVGVLRMATGGIVGGAMYSGDRMHTMLNAGEAVFTQAHFGNVVKLLDQTVNGGGGGGMLSTRVSGNDLLIVLDRASKTRGRTF